MKSIGGYFGLTCGDNPLYYNDGIYLNSCRNALRYLIRTLGIQKIHIPVFTCEVIKKAILSENCKVLSYNIDENFFPLQDIPKSDFILYNNYFGLTEDKVKIVATIFPNLIVDNAQAFYSHVTGRASIYSLRKFFGVPDGGILRGKDIPKLNLETSTSYEVMAHLLIRRDLGAEAGYSSFIKDEEIISHYPVLQISSLTLSLLGNIDYKKVRQRRIENFLQLKENLISLFPYSKNEEFVPLVFPLFIEDGNSLRNKLISNKVFCARYWPNVLDDKNSSSFEKNLAKNIISIPLDQRYGKKEMEYILELIQ